MESWRPKEKEEVEARPVEPGAAFRDWGSNLGLRQLPSLGQQFQGLKTRVVSSRQDGVVLTTLDHHSPPADLATDMAFPGMGGGLMSGGGMLGGAGAAGELSEEKVKEMQMVKAMSTAMESCVGKSAISGVMGFGLGGMFGLFMSSMRYDTSMSTNSEAVAKMPVREQLRTGFKDMGRSSWSSAKNFGRVALLFTGIECGIEGFRGKNAIENNVAAGCGAGAILAKNAGPQAMLVGCAGFAAFSAAIESYMHMESNDPAREPIT